MKIHYLHDLFEPRHIAVVGASDKTGSIGQTVFANLLEHADRGSMLSPVNLRHRMVGGLRTVRSVKNLPDIPDVVVITSPPASYESVLRDCAEKKVRFVILIQPSSEPRREDPVLTEAAVRLASDLGLRLLGPTSVGLMRTASGLNAGTYRGMLRKGKIALVSHSGSLCSAILDWAADKGYGFSTVLALGAGAGNIGFGEILDFLVNDEQTDAIVLHMHHVMGGRTLMSALHAAAWAKPVIALKSGRADESPGDDAPHVADRVRAEEVFHRAMVRTGVMQVRNFAQLAGAVRLLNLRRNIHGDRLAIVNNGFGLGVVTRDTLFDMRGRLAEFSPATREALREALPNRTVDNPLDLFGNAGALRFRTAVRLCLDDPQIDAVLVIYSPQTDDREEHFKTAEMMVQLQGEYPDKPLLLSWMGGERAAKCRALFAKHRCLHFDMPEFAIEAFQSLVRFRRHQKRLLTLPEKSKRRETVPDLDTAREIIAAARHGNIRLLPEHVSKALLSRFNIQSNYTAPATGKEEAVRLAESIGYPVAMKINSPAVVHKANVGGVRLNLRRREEVEQAYEDIIRNVTVMQPQAPVYGVTVQSMLPEYHSREVKISVSRDAIFGPVLMFSADGDASVQNDYAIALPPMNAGVIRDLISRTRVSRTFGAHKNMRPIDFAALENVFYNVSELIAGLPEITELKINLLLSPQGAVATDVRALLGDDGPKPRYEHMAIMPYPRRFERRLTLKNGDNVLIRPIREDDARAIQNFVRSLSESSRYNRFMSNIKELSDKMLVRFTRLDYDRNIAFMMLPDEDGAETVWSIARYVTDPDMEACEFAVSVLDELQGRGIASVMMNHLFDAARDQGLKSMRGEVLADNRPMRALVKKLGFTVSPDADDPDIVLVNKIL